MYSSAMHLACRNIKKMFKGPTAFFTFQLFTFLRPDVIVGQTIFCCVSYKTPPPPYLPFCPRAVGCKL